MLRNVNPHRPQHLTIAWLGVLASGALLISGAWAIRGAADPRADSASLLVEFVWLFVVSFGVLLLPYLLLARRGTRGRVRRPLPR
jgi:hypothetical protein